MQHLFKTSPACTDQHEGLRFGGQPQTCPVSEFHPSPGTCFRPNQIGWKMHPSVPARPSKAERRTDGGKEQQYVWGLSCCFDCLFIARLKGALCSLTNGDIELLDTIIRVVPGPVGWVYLCTIWGIIKLTIFWEWRSWHESQPLPGNVLSHLPLET